MADNVVIEFVGPPAAGKTTLSKAVVEQLEDRGYEACKPATRIAEYNTPKRIGLKLPITIQWIVSNPVTATFDTFTILRSNQENISDYVNLLFNWHYVCGLHSYSNAEITILDQGVFQALWAIGYRSRLDWKKSLRCIEIPEPSVPDLVIIVRSGESVLVDRLGSSHNSKTRVLDTDQENVRRAIQGVNLISELLNDFIEENHELEYMEIDNHPDSNFQTCVDSIVNKVSRIVDET